jgi:hypothetical protein
MDNQKLQRVKLHLINWIVQIQDHTLIEKIKSLMGTSNENLQLTKEQELILSLSQVNEIGIFKNSDPLDNNFKPDYVL